jgi:hypothetical protein
MMGLTKSAIFFLFVGLCCANTDWMKRIWPWGLALPWLDRPSYAPVDVSNDSLRFKRKLFLCLYFIV